MSQGQVTGCQCHQQTLLCADSHKLHCLVQRLRIFCDTTMQSVDILLSYGSCIAPSIFYTSNDQQCDELRTAPSHTPHNIHLTIRSFITSSSKRENRRGNTHTNTQCFGAHIRYWQMPAVEWILFGAWSWVWRRSEFDGWHQQIENRRKWSVLHRIDYVIFGEKFVGWIYHNRLTCEWAWWVNWVWIEEFNYGCVTMRFRRKNECLFR